MSSCVTGIPTSPSLSIIFSWGSYLLYLIRSSRLFNCSLKDFSVSSLYIYDNYCISNLCSLIRCFSSWVRSLRYLLGAPANIYPDITVWPSPRTDPAAKTPKASTLAPLPTEAPIPIKELSSIVQASRLTFAPMYTLSPIVTLSPAFELLLAILVKS